MDDGLRRTLEEVGEQGGSVVVLTGAGISAESGIPTFRGADGFWTVGSREYEPQEIATHAMFARETEEVWGWYLYRRARCRGAAPNAAHLALVELERHLGERFLLITQNVDGLHRAAGSAHLYEIHGNIHTMRCDQGCTRRTWPVPEELGDWPRERRHDDGAVRALRCRDCGGWGRPHVLWFDEYYDEEYYRFESSIEAASRADLLLVIGTSGATNLPMQIGQVVAHRGAAIVDVNPDDNPFAEAAAALDRGFAVRGTAVERVPGIVEALTRRLTPR